ncbi:ChaN family lipoprotein [Tropicimonas marinistellae]|uniref:ChaN family lipoprotein n=1 Tax=Tropicimonas marinistellae TaxID=1739787 RepID=UPI0008358EEB|nr:ChaN family lipoprotein [Tropicimonas marinistellae]
MRPLLIPFSLVLFASQVPAAEIESVDAFDPGAADVILLGEVHDNPAHHRNQARAVVDLAPSALVFEMLSEDKARIVNGMERDDARAMAEALDWKHSGWPDFSMYHEIIAAVPDTPVYGAAVPRSDLSEAIGQGAAATFGDGAETFGLVPLPEAEQAEREALQMEAHCNALPEEMLPGMVEAQRLRDARFSETTLAALRETGGPVVVITGNGHARRDWGMPHYLAAAAPDVQVVTLGQFEAPFAEAPDLVPHDTWIVTEPAEREDPCAVFEKG